MDLYNKNGSRVLYEPSPGSILYDKDGRRVIYDPPITRKSSNSYTSPTYNNYSETQDQQYNLFIDFLEPREKIVITIHEKTIYLIFLGLLLGGCFLFFSNISRWIVGIMNDGGFPYNFIAGFYYYTLIKPIEIFISGAKWIWNLNFMESTSLDTIINIFILLFYVQIWILLIFGIFAVMRNKLASKVLKDMPEIGDENSAKLEASGSLITLYILPLLLGLICYGIAAIFHFIF